MSFHLWKISVILYSLLDSKYEGILFLLNSVTAYQLTLCHIPEHLDHHEHLCENLKSLTHDGSFDSFLPQLMKKTEYFVSTASSFIRKVQHPLFCFIVNTLLQTILFFPSWHLIYEGGMLIC